MLRIRLFTLLLIFTVVASLALHTFPARAQPSYAPGVRPGDFVTYGEFSQNSTLPYSPIFPANVSTLKFQVESVNGPAHFVNATFQFTYKNGTQSTQPLSGDTGTGQGNLFPYMVAGNLTAGDLLYNNPSSFYPYIFNETVERVYAGALRTVNLLNLTITLPGENARVVFYWDAQTGFVLDGAEYFNATAPTPSAFSIHFKATETNVWTPSTGPDYSLDASSLSSAVLHGGETTRFRLDLANLNGFTGDINLSFSVPSANTTQHPRVTLNPTSISLSTTTPTANALLTVAANSTTPTGQYMINVNATSGTTNHRAKLLVVVAPPDFILSASPGNLTIFQGTSKNSIITVTGRGGFTGTVVLQAQTQPFGTIVTATLNRTILILNSTITSANSTLTVDATHSSPGATSVYVNAASTTISQNIYLFVNVTGPDFHISASPSSLAIRQGQTDQSTITLTSVLGFAGTVNLSATVYGTVSATLSNSSVNLSAGAVADSTLTVTVPSTTPPGLASVYVTGTGANGLSHTVYLQLNVTGPDFTISASNSFLSLQAGQTANTNLTLSSRDGFSGTITLTASSYSNLQSTLNPLSVTLNSTRLSSTALLTITVPLGTTPGYYSISVAATSGNLGHYVYVQVSVIGPDFGISTNPGFLSIRQGNTGKASISLTSIDNFSGNVTFSISSSLYLATLFSGNPVQLAAGGSANTTLTVQTFSFTPAGNYYFQITASSGALVHYSQVSVYVIGPDFSLSASPSFLVLPQGGSASSTVSITSIDNLNGTATIFDAFSNPIIVSPFSVNVTLLANSTSTATFTLSVPANTVPGSYYVHMTVYLRSVTHDIFIPVQVTGPDFTLLATPSSLTIQRGGTGTSTVIVNGLNGFNGTVSLTFSSYGLTTTPANANVTLTPSGTASLNVTIQAPMSTLPGSYYVYVNARSGFITHYTQIYVQVIGPDFSIQANPTFLVVQAGGSGQSTIQLSSLNGFNGNVTLTASFFVGGTNATFSPVKVTLTPQTVRLGSGTTGSATLDVTSTLAGAGQNFTIYIIATGNNETHYTQVSVSIIGPTFRLSTDHSFLVIPVGGSATAIITTTSVDGFSGQVSLSAVSFSTFHVSIAPENITLGPGGSLNSTLSITVPIGTASNWYYSLVVTGTSNGISRSIYMTIQVIAPSFSLTVSPIFLSLAAGNTGHATVALTGFNGFSDTIKLSSSSSPTGLTTNLTPNAITLNSTTTTDTSLLTINVPANTSPGFYNVNINATTNSLFENITVLVQVVGPDFSLSTNPVAFQISPGASANAVITISGTNGFNGTVHLFGAVSAGPGVTATFSPANVTLTPSQQNSISILSIDVAPGTYAGPYLITIIGSLVTNSNATSLVHYTTVSVMVPEIPNFQMLVSTGLLSIDQGGSGKLFLTITSLNGFSGNVTITTQITAQGLTVSPIQTTVTLSMNSTVQTSLTISVGTNTPPGIYSLALNATSSGITHPNGIEIAVLRHPDFTLVANPSTLTITQGSSTPTTLTLSGINGFAGLVNFTAYASGPGSGLQESFSPLNVTLSTSAPIATIVMTVTADPSTLLGSYAITINVISYNGGNFTIHSITIYATILAKPDFSISLSPSFLTVQAGASAGFKVTLVSLNGFLGVVQVYSAPSPSGATISPDQIAVSLSVGGTNDTTLSISTTRATTPGTYTITLIGNTTIGFHATNLALTVTPPADFSLKSNPAGLIIVSGASAPSTISVSPINGFTSPVNLKVIGQSGFTTSFSVNPIIRGSGTSTLNITIASSVSSGSYILTVTGSSGSITHSATLNITVAASAKTTFAVTQVSWSHRLSLSKNSATQTFTFNVKNTGTSPAYVELLAAGNSTNLKSFFNIESQVSVLSPGASMTIALTQSFNATSIGLKFNFTIQLFYGTSIDPSGTILGPHTIQVVKGSFAIVK